MYGLIHKALESMVLSHHGEVYLEKRFSRLQKWGVILS